MAPTLISNPIKIENFHPAEITASSPPEELVIQDYPENSEGQSSKMSLMQLYRTAGKSKDKSSLTDPEKLRLFFIVLIHECMDLKEKQAKMQMDDLTLMQKIKQNLFEKLQETNAEIQNNFLVTFFGTLETVMTQVAIVLGFVSLAFGYQFAVLTLIASFIGVCGKAAYMYFKSLEDLLKSEMVMQMQAHQILKEAIKRIADTINLSFKDRQELARAISDEVQKFHHLAKCVCRNIT